MANAQDELSIANGHLKTVELGLKALATESKAADLLYEWLRLVRIEHAAAIRIALESEPECSCCGGPLSCRACSWGS